MTIAATIHSALDTIRAAIPGCVGLQVDRYDTWTAVRIRVDTDEAVRVLAQKLGAKIERPCYGGRWWMSATVRDGDVETVIDGPHREGDSPRVDRDALDSAFDRARVVALELGAQLDQDVSDLAGALDDADHPPPECETCLGSGLLGFKDGHRKCLDCNGSGVEP